MSTRVTLSRLWSAKIDGELSPAEVEAVEAILDLDLRAAHLRDEATIGHRFLLSEGGKDTLLRVRRDFDAHATVIDLVTTDGRSQTPESWSTVVRDAEAAVAAVQRLRDEAEAEAGHRPLVFMGSGISTAPHFEAASFAERLRKHLGDLDLDYLLESPALPAQGWDGRADLVILYAGHEPNPQIGAALIQYARSGAIVLMLTNHDVGMWGYLDGIKALRAPADSRDIEHVAAWVRGAQPELRARASARNSLFSRIREQLPRARARLASLHLPDFEGIGLSRQDALRLLSTPSAFSAASQTEVWSLQQLIGQHSVPKLYFETYSQRHRFVDARPTDEWFDLVLAPDFSQTQVRALSTICQRQHWSSEDVLLTVEFVLARTSAESIARTWKLDTYTEWHDLYLRSRSPSPPETD